MLKRYRQLQVKDLPKVPTWRLERDLKGYYSTNVPPDSSRGVIIIACDPQLKGSKPYKVKHGSSLNLMNVSIFA